MLSLPAPRVQRTRESSLENLGGAFFRIVWTNPPMLEDFLSNAAKNIPVPRRDSEVERLWSGISVYRSSAQATRKGRGFPWLGNAYIAEVRLPVDGTIHVERTTASRGHFTRWGSANTMLASVVRVYPIGER